MKFPFPNIAFPLTSILLLFFPLQAALGTTYGVDIQMVCSTNETETFNGTYGNGNVPGYYVDPTFFVSPSAPNNIRIDIGDSDTIVFAGDSVSNEYGTEPESSQANLLATLNNPGDVELNLNGSGGYSDKYNFTVDASSFSGFGSSHTTITSGGELSSDPNLTWTGPASGYDEIYVSLYNTTTQISQYMTLSTGATSWTPPSMLGDGTWIFSVEYYEANAGAFTTSTPEDSNGGLLGGWDGVESVSKMDEDTAAFSVIPEPKTWVLLFIAIMGFAGATATKRVRIRLG